MLRRCNFHVPDPFIRVCRKLTSRVILAARSIAPPVTTLYAIQIGIPLVVLL
jgi:hypothetical protein